MKWFGVFLLLLSLLMVFISVLVILIFIFVYVFLLFFIMFGFFLVVEWIKIWGLNFFMICLFLLKLRRLIFFRRFLVWEWVSFNIFYLLELRNFFMIVWLRRLEVLVMIMCCFFVMLILKWLLGNLFKYILWCLLL